MGLMRLHTANEEESRALRELAGAAGSLLSFVGFVVLFFALGEDTIATATRIYGYSIRQICVLLWAVPASTGLIAVLFTLGRRTEFLRIGIADFLAILTLCLWNTHTLIWLLPAVGAVALWTYCVQATTTTILRARKGRPRTPAPAETRGPAGLIWPDVGLLFLWIYWLAGMSAYYLSPPMRGWLQAHREDPVLFVVMSVVPSLVYAAMWFWLLIDCWRRQDMNQDARMLWLVFIFAGWFVGPTCYYVFVKRPEMAADKQVGDRRAGFGG